MPVFLIAQRRFPVILLLFPVLDFKRVKQRSGFFARVACHFRLGGPGVAVPEKLACESSSRSERSEDLAPNGLEILWMAEGQAEACIQEIARRQLCLGERGALALQPAQIIRRRAGSHTVDRFRLAVDGKNSPAATQKLERVIARSAAKIDRKALVFYSLHIEQI